MTHKRYANRVDSNQTNIVKALRKIHGVSVALDHDDIIVGFQGRTYWFEIKDPEKTLKKDGTFKKGAIKDTQLKLMNEFSGHYSIVTSFEQILNEIGLND